MSKSFNPSDAESQESGSPSDGDDFSELARQRRFDAEKESAVRPPDFIQGIERSEFSLVFDPQAIPFQYIDPEQLIHLVHSNYSAQLDPPDLGALIRQSSIEAVQQMSRTERLAAAWALPDANIEFKAGRLSTKYGFVPIRSIYIDYEKILVAVQGITSLAEAVTYEIIELLWRSAGVERKYSEIEDFVRLKSYATATSVDFGATANDFLADSFRNLLVSSFSQGGQFAGSFGPRSHRHDFKPSQNVVSTVTLDELDLRVAHFDLDTGSNYTGLLKLSVTAKDDHGTGRLRAASHLPFEEHVRLLDALRVALVKSGSPPE